MSTVALGVLLLAVGLCLAPVAVYLLWSGVFGWTQSSDSQAERLLDSATASNDRPVAEEDREDNTTSRGQDRLARRREAEAIRRARERKVAERRAEDDAVREQAQQQLLQRRALGSPQTSRSETEGHKDDRWAAQRREADKREAEARETAKRDAEKREAERREVEQREAEVKEVARRQQEVAAVTRNRVRIDAALRKAGENWCCGCSDVDLITQIEQRVICCDSSVGRGIIESWRNLVWEILCIVTEDTDIGRRLRVALDYLDQLRMKLKADARLIGSETTREDVARWREYTADIPDWC